MQVNIHEAKTNFSKLVKRVIEGEEITIAHDHVPVAKLVKIMHSDQKRKLGSAKSKIRISNDFDQPLDDFKEYTH
jgi:prevent-host-death family protein